MEREALEAMGNGELVAGADASHAASVLAQSDLIAYIGAIDAREAWRGDGALSCANWVAARYKVAYATATEWVRMARALVELPALAEVFAEAKTSFESIALATKLAEPETDALVAAQTEVATASELKEELRRKEAAASEGELKRPSLRWWPEAEGYTRFSGSLPTEEGAVVIAAIERAVIKDEAPNPETGTYDPVDVQAGNALVRLASTALIHDQDRDRATVVVHCSLDALMSGQGEAELASGGYISAEVVRRLACEGRIECVFENQAGVVGIGNIFSRRPSPKVERYLKHRDGGCRFPGCGNKKFLHIHHVVFWINQGKTATCNLACLCTRHHGLVHEGRWSMVGNPEPGGTLLFLRPDGRVFEPGVDPDPEFVRPRAREGSDRPPERGSRPPTMRGDQEVWAAATLGAL